MGEKNHVFYDVSRNMFDDSWNIVNRGNENRIFNGFDELGLVENFYKLSVGDGRRDFGGQHGCGFGFDGNFVNGNGHVGISGLHHPMEPKDYVEYPFDVRRQELRGLFGGNNGNQRQCVTNSMVNGYDDHFSGRFGVDGREDGLGFEMQNRYMMNAHVLGFEKKNPYMMNAPVFGDGLGLPGVFGREDFGVRDPLNGSNRFSMLNERLSRGSSSLGNHQPLMMEDYGCQDYQIRFAKSLLKKSALCSNVQHDVSRESGLAQSIFEYDGTGGLGFGPESWRSISCIAKTQLGCRLLQRMLNEKKCQDVELIFNDVIDYVPELSLDPYGNYLVQKLLDVCNHEQMNQVVRVITRNPEESVRICKNPHGTRVVQKIIEKVRTWQQTALVVKALEAGFLDLITDVNGNHVLQRCLQCFTEEHNKFIFEGATKFCAQIATHRYGCCVLNQCIAHSSRCYRDKLVTEICANGLQLAQDSFGNYVIQNILELKIPSAAVALISALKGHFVLLSMQKFGSHVVEKCLKCYDQSRPVIIHELLSVPCFGQLLQHPFANYVIQSALHVTKGPARAILVKALKPYKTLHTNPYSKRIFSRNLMKK